MSISDSIADMLTKIRNANMAKHEKVEVIPTKIKLEIIKILKNEGFIKNFKKVTEKKKVSIRIFLKYTDKNEPIIHNIKRLSTPGRRQYTKAQNIPRLFNGIGSIILSTSEMGITTGKKARAKGIGGEILCAVW